MQDFQLLYFSWAGLYDGRYDNVMLQQLVLKDDKYSKVKENVRKYEVIIIDEVSMLSKKAFDQLELVCRLISVVPITLNIFCTTKKLQQTKPIK